MNASLGPCIGHGYVAGIGRGLIFASEKPNFLTIQHNRTGIRYWVARERINWRK